MPRKAKNPVEIGKQFERLIILEIYPETGGDSKALCKCSCGIEKIITCEAIRGGQKSCGCIRYEKGKPPTSLRHGHSVQGKHGSKTYKAWGCMKQRCYSTKDKKYDLYGGRGIIVCERWHTFENFLYDMGEAPIGYTLDRINSNGNYEPSNCRWATVIEQNNNRSCCRYIEYKGLTQTVAQWARECNMNPATLIARLNKGWSVERALTTPVRSKK